MLKTQELLLGILFFFIGHTLVWFQLNGQFKWDWFRNNEFLLAAAGLIISYFYIWGTKHTVQSFDGLLWPARFVGFSIGIFVYAIFVEIFFSEGINLKTLVSLALCLVLIAIQVLWK